MNGFSRERMFWVVLGLAGAAVLYLVLGGYSGAIGDDNRVGYGLYLAIWGGVIAVGLISRPLGSSLRHLAVWLLVVLVLVAGYQSRYELQDIASRLSAGIIPGSPLSRADMEGRATATLIKGMDGHFRARLLLDGASVEAVVDTGATSTVLTARDAERAGIDIDRLSFTVPIGTANGNALAAAARLREISVGPISRSNMPVLVAAPGSLGQSLLGMNFIGSLSGFDLRGDRLILRD